MSVQFPTVHAVIPLLPKLLPYVEALHKEPLIDPKGLVSIVTASEKIHFARLDDPEKPMLKIDEKGRVTLYMVWAHPDNPLDPDYIVALVCPETLDSHGKKMYKPEMIMRGAKANVMIVGGMSCCGSSVQSHVTQIDSKGKALDIAGVPLGGMPHPEHANWLKGKVHVVKGHEGAHALLHLAQDVLAPRMPHNKQVAHDCDHGGNYVQYAAKARNDLVIS
jgi:hypothetical protein